jgi:hypothetical protein
MIGVFEVRRRQENSKVLNVSVVRECWPKVSPKLPRNS